MDGIKTTAGVVTAAAVVMVFVFLTFATLSMIQRASRPVPPLAPPSATQPPVTRVGA